VTGLELGGAASWVADVVRRAGERGCSIRVHVRTVGGLPQGRGSEFSRFRYRDFEGLVAPDDVLVLQSPRGAVQVAPDGHELLVASREPSVVAQWPEVHFALIEALRRQGLCHLHAAATARGDDCVVVLGPSGVGKTTALLQFLRAGWHLVADDSIFMYEGLEGGRLECVGWPDPVRVTPWLAAHTSELRGRLEPDADGKQRVAATADLTAQRQPWAAPSALWLLAPGDRAEPSRVWPMGSAEAFCALVPLSPLLMTARGHAAAHVSMLVHLFRQARIHGAALGEDLLRPGRVEALCAAGPEGRECT
jgi:ribosomal protein S28E/S33